jgi:hypothetical protein
MKQQKEIAVLIALVIIGAAVWFWNTRQNPAAAGASSIATSYAPINVENPAIRWWKLDKVRKTEYKGTGRDPFSAVPTPPPPPVVPKPGDKNYVEPPHPPPPPPELPVKFFGYGTVPNGTARRAFLTDGDEVYVVAEGDTLLSRFRILKIGNATLDFEEISSGRQGKANLEDAGPGSGPGTGLGAGPAGPSSGIGPG